MPSAQPTSLLKAVEEMIKEMVGSIDKKLIISYPELWQKVTYFEWL